MGQTRTRTKGVYTEADGSKTISKTYKGERIFTRLGIVGQQGAEDWLRREIENREREKERRASAQYLFAECARRYLEESKEKASIDAIAIHISAVVPYIGHLPVEKIHDGTLAQFVESRVLEGVTATTINRALEVVRTILNKSARVYRDIETGTPWLKQAPPLITMLKELPKPAHHLSWVEQDKLLKELPNHLATMVLFGINTGLRDGNICGLKWEWEVFVPEIERSVFVIPPQFHKGGKLTNLNHVVILNDVAWPIINSQRGRHKEYVFVYRQERRVNLDIEPSMKFHRIDTINNNAWQAARKRVGLSDVRVHDTRHTYATRLRAAGVSQEDRAALLGHVTNSMPEHYGVADIIRLLNFSNLVTQRNLTCTVLSVVNR